MVLSIVCLIALTACKLTLTLFIVNLKMPIKTIPMFKFEITFIAFKISFIFVNTQIVFVYFSLSFGWIITKCTLKLNKPYLIVAGIRAEYPMFVVSPGHSSDNGSHPPDWVSLPPEQSLVSGHPSPESSSLVTPSMSVDGDTEEFVFL